MKTFIIISLTLMATHRLYCTCFGQYRGLKEFLLDYMNADITNKGFSEFTQTLFGESTL